MFLIDNNLSPRIANQIQDSFPGCQHVFSLGMDQVSDEAVFNYAKNNKCPDIIILSIFIYKHLTVNILKVIPINK